MAFRVLRFMIAADGKRGDRQALSSDDDVSQRFPSITVEQYLRLAGLI